MAVVHQTARVAPFTAPSVGTPTHSKLAQCILGTTHDSRHTGMLGLRLTCCPRGPIGPVRAGSTVIGSAEAIPRLRERSRNRGSERDAPHYRARRLRTCVMGHFQITPGPTGCKAGLAAGREEIPGALVTYPPEGHRRFQVPKVSQGYLAHRTTPAAAVTYPRFVKPNRGNDALRIRHVAPPKCLAAREYGQSFCDLGWPIPTAAITQSPFIGLSGPLKERPARPRVLSRGARRLPMCRAVATVRSAI